MFCFRSKMSPQTQVFDSFATSIILGGYWTFSIMATHDRVYLEVEAGDRT